VCVCVSMCVCVHVYVHMCVGVCVCISVYDCVWGGERRGMTVCLNVWVYYVCVVRVDIHICIWDTYMYMGYIYVYGTLPQRT